MINANLIKKNSSETISLWRLSKFLFYSICIHQDDNDAVEILKDCNDIHKTNCIFIISDKICTRVYASNHLGEVLSMEPIVSVYPREFWLWKNHKEIIQLLFNSESIKYNQESCEYDNWHPNEAL